MFFSLMILPYETSIFIRLNLRMLMFLICQKLLHEYSLLNLSFLLIFYINLFISCLLYKFYMRRLIHPVKMLAGMLAMMAILSIFAYMSVEGSLVHNFKKQYPIVGILFIVFTGCFVTYTLGSLLVFLLGILLPFCGKRHSLLYITAIYICYTKVINCR
jgi:hypothetical protein